MLEQHKEREDFDQHNKRNIENFRRIHWKTIQGKKRMNNRNGDRGVRHHEARFGHFGHDVPSRRGWRDAHHQPLDELMKVVILDFFRKLEPNAFNDWLTAIEDYFDWCNVWGDQKVR